MRALGLRNIRGDAISRRLDTITLEEHMMEKYGISRETVRTFLSPDEGGGFGLGPDALSGYTAYAARHAASGSTSATKRHTNVSRRQQRHRAPDREDSDSGIDRRQHSLEDVCRNAVNFAALDRAGAPARIRLDSTAVWVKHDGDACEV